MSKKIKNSETKSKRNSGSPTNQLSVRLGEFRIDLAAKEDRAFYGTKHILRVDSAEDQLRVVVDGKLYTADGLGDAVPQICQSDGENYMLRFGEYWCMRFQGNRPFLMRKRNGLDIIGRLLSAPTHEIRYNEFIKMDACNTQRPKVDYDELRISDTQEQADERGLILKKNEEKELSVLENNRREAIEAHAPDSDMIIHDCTQEINKILARAKSRWKPPVTKSQKNGAWAVAKAVKAAILSIRDENEEMGNHLKTCIKTGSYLKYAPSEKIAWQIES